MQKIIVKCYWLIQKEKILNSPFKLTIHCKPYATNITNDPSLSAVHRGNLHADSLEFFNGGNQLIQNILQVNFTGLTGSIEFSDRNLIHPAYE